MDLFRTDVEKYCYIKQRSHHNFSREIPVATRKLNGDENWGIFVRQKIHYYSFCGPHALDETTKVPSYVDVIPYNKTE